MLNFAHGSVQWLTTQVLNTTIAVTGLGFAPKALRFYWVGLQSNSPTNAATQTLSERRGVGFASSATSRASVGTFSSDNVSNADCGSVFTTTAAVITIDGTGTVDGLLDINSFDADGFTLIVDDVAIANITVFWEAWGGADITNVTIGSIAEPASAPTSTSHTATGFVPDASGNIIYDQIVMFAGIQSVAASGVGQGTDSGLCVGFGMKDGLNARSDEYVCACGNSDDGSATMDTDGYTSNASITMIVIGGGNPNALAIYDGCLSADTFSLNWSYAATANRRSIYMAIKGGNWYVGSTTIAGNTLNSTTSVSPNLPFNLRGISLIGSMKLIDTAVTSSVNDRISIGSALSTISRNSAGVLDENGTANSEIDLTLNYDAVLSFPSTSGTLQTAYDISGFSANSFSLITDVAGGTTGDFIGYLAFGDRTRSSASIGHPFIC